jgi:hypothetical protein
MTPRRLSQSEIAAARKAQRQNEMEHAIAAGRLALRRMAPAEREKSEARRATIRTGAEQRRHRRDAGGSSRAPGGRT